MTRLRENWVQSWQLGRFEFEIEWVAKASYYSFTFSINTPAKKLAKINRESGYPS